MIVAIVSLAILATIYLIMKSNMSDPYGTYHLGLNVHPNDKPEGQRQTTEWLNMGYWKDRKYYPEACEALALKVIQEGRPIPNGRVLGWSLPAGIPFVIQEPLLDVGHGCGDSLLLHLTNASVPIPETLSGITSLKTHSNRARNRISVIQNTLEQASKCQVKVWCADAVYSPGNSPSDHPLCPPPPSPSSEFLYSTITAIDCAYHFVTKEFFLQQCFARLTPGGRIALADLTISKPPPSLLYYIVTTLLSVDKENLMTIEEYEACLVRAGYVDIKIEDISNDVFPQFTGFLKTKGVLWYLTAMVFRWWYTAGGQYVVVGASKPK